ncbi:hypothetical protein DB346_25090 [Verrucomicrobia bacterium LW23]|nr:hypothetical protein DB346_25090 [Verrucomicrobia bacterium LW23]
MSHNDTNPIAEPNPHIKPGAPGSTEHVVCGFFDDASSADAAIKDLIERGYPRTHIGVAYRDNRGLDVTPPSDWQWHSLTLPVPHGPAGERDTPQPVPTAVVTPSNYVDPTLPPAPYPGDALHPMPTAAPSPEVARVESQPVVADTDNDGDVDSDDENAPHFVVAVAAHDTTEAANILKSHNGDVGDANRIRSDVALMTGGTVAGAVAGAVLGGPAGAFVGGTVAGALAAATASSE